MQPHLLYPHDTGTSQHEIQGPHLKFIFPSESPCRAEHKCPKLEFTNPNTRTCMWETRSKSPKITRSPPSETSWHVPLPYLENPSPVFGGSYTRHKFVFRTTTGLLGASSLRVQPLVCPLRSNTASPSTEQGGRATVMETSCLKLLADPDLRTSGWATHNTEEAPFLALVGGTRESKVAMMLAVLMSRCTMPGSKGFKKIRANNLDQAWP